MFNWWGTTEAQGAKGEATKDEGNEGLTSSVEGDVEQRVESKADEEGATDLDYAKDIAKNVGSKELIVCVVFYSIVPSTEYINYWC